MFKYLETHRNPSDLIKKVVIDYIITSSDLDKFSHKRTKKELVDCVIVILDASISKKDTDNKTILIPKNSNIFSKHELFNKYNYRTFIEAVNILEKKKIISLVEKGHIQIDMNEDGLFSLGEKKGITSIYEINEYSTWDIKISHINRLKLKYNKDKYDYDAIVRDSDKKVLYALEDKNVRYINKSLCQMGYSEFQYHRIFQDDNKKCGRIYNILQTVKKTEREKIYKEMDWCEVDFHAMAPNTIYMLNTGKLYNGEMYNDILEDLEIEREYWKIYRPMIKKFFILVLNTKNKEEAKKAIRQLLCKDYGIYTNLKKEYDTGIFKKYLKGSNIENEEVKQYKFTEKDILESFEKVHKEIKNEFYNSSYQKTQYIESEIALKVMKFMIKIKEIPLSIHDCFICKSEKKDLIYKYMNKQFKKVIKRYSNNNYYYNIDNNNNNIKFSNNNILKIIILNNNNNIKILRSITIINIITKIINPENFP